MKWPINPVKSSIQLIIAVLLTVACLGVSYAYVIYGFYWPGATAKFYVSWDNGGPFDTAFIEAMNKWNGLSNFTYSSDTSKLVDPCNSVSVPDYENGYRFSSDDCGRGWGATTLAMTYLRFIGSEVIDTDIVFNSNVSWGVHNSATDSPIDFRRVAVHELGHALGLAHEPTNTAAIMYPTYSMTIIEPQADDIDGITYLYPLSPDLVVINPSVNDSTLTPGQSFTISATVKNQGSDSSSSTTLRYYRSTNSTITTGDTPVGTDAVSALSPNGTSPESIMVSAPTTNGTYWVGACVDAVSGESPTNNQCSTGVQITVRYLNPDLVVISPSVNDSTLTPGQTFTISATVKNQGSDSSSSTTLRYYRSTNSTISTLDTEIGTGAVSALSPNGTSPESITVSAPTTGGTYWVGACVDTVSDESTTNNQCSTGVQITVKSLNPDLVVINPSVSDTNLTPGQSFTISATVKNQGSGSSSSTTLRYYRSTNSTISTLDTEIGTGAVSALSPNGTSPESITVSAPTTGGTYWVGACVDTVSDESTTNNQCSTGVQITVKSLNPDLVVINPSVSDTNLTPGQSFTISATVKNQGSGSSSSTTLRYYRSTNSYISTLDTEIGTGAVSALSPNGTSPESITVSAPTTGGTYWVGACVNAVSGESPTNNQCSTGVQIRVTSLNPDLNDVIVDFGDPYGIYVRYNDTSWSKLHPTSPEFAAVGDMDGNGKDDVIIDFGASGVWVRMNNTSWTKLHSFNPEGISTGDMDGNGMDEVVFDFGASGVWARMNNETWTRVHSQSTEIMLTADMDGNGQADVIMDFGASGVWVRMNNSSWSRLHPSSPDSIARGDMDGNDKDDVIIDFGASGVWVRMNNTSWMKLHPSNPEFITIGDMDGNGMDEVIFDFGAGGIWVRVNNTSWAKLHPSNPDGIATGDMDSNGLDEVIIDFPGSGMWVRYNNTNWTKFHPANCEQMATGNIDGY